MFTGVENLYKWALPSWFPSISGGVIPLPEQLRYNHGNQRLCNAGLCGLCCRSNGRPRSSFFLFSPFLVVRGRSRSLHRLVELVLVGCSWCFQNCVFTLRIRLVCMLSAPTYSACSCACSFCSFVGAVSTVCSVMWDLTFYSVQDPLTEQVGTAPPVCWRHGFSMQLLSLSSSVVSACQFLKLWYLFWMYKTLFFHWLCPNHQLGVDTKYSVNRVSFWAEGKLKKYIKASEFKI